MQGLARSLQSWPCRPHSARHLQYVVWVLTALSLALCLLSLQLLDANSYDGSGSKKPRGTRRHRNIRNIEELQPSAQKPFLASNKETQLWWRSKHDTGISESRYEAYEVQPVFRAEAAGKDDNADHSVGQKYLHTYEHSQEDYPEEISLEGMNVSLFLHQPKSRKETIRTSKHEERLSPSKPKQKLYVVAASDDLGDQMFQYAALYGIGRLNKRVPIAAGNFTISGPFRGNYMIKQGDVPNNVTVLQENAAGIYTQELTTLPAAPVQLCCHLHSFRYWILHHNSVRRQFRVRKDIQANAYTLLVKYGERQLARNAAQDSSKLTDLYGKFPPKHTSQFNYVAVHVDLPSTSQRQAGIRVPPPSYLRQAMAFYRKEYRRSLFLIFTPARHRQWCQENLNVSEADVLLADDISPGLLLATTLLCNSTVITVGPLSWWIGWLNKGKTVYYADWTVPGTPMDAAYMDEDYFPPEWIGYGSNGAHPTHNATLLEAGASHR